MNGAFINPSDTGVVTTNTPISSGATLYIFTPVSHGSQVIRPYVFNFDQNLVNMFSAGGATETVRRINTYDNNNVVHAILPSRNGIPLNTSVLDALYSFALIIDSSEQTRSQLAFGKPQRRIILTGYFLDEPIAPMTLYSSNPVLNPNALMVFTHNNSISKNFGRGFGASVTDNMAINAQVDIVPQLTDSMSDDHLQFCDVGSITNSFKPDRWSNEPIPTGNHLDLASRGGLSTTINDRIKSPRSQLINLAHGVDQAITVANSQSKIYGGLERSLVGNDPHDEFVGTLYSYFQQPDYAAIHQGINPSEHIPISKLCSIYPHIEVVPCEIPYNPVHDSMDQREMTIQTVLSSMISHSVAAMATSNILGTIVFRYSSWNKNPMEGQGGSWQIVNASLLIGEDNANGTRLHDSIQKFMMNVELSLFPILLKMGGEFDLSVSYDSTNNTVIDLNFLDMPQQHGFYTDQCRLGGIKSPAVGSAIHSNNNINQFNALIDQLSVSGILEDPEGTIGPALREQFMGPMSPMVSEPNELEHGVIGPDDWDFSGGDDEWKLK